MCDRGSQFTAGLDEIFTTEGIKVLKTPVRTLLASSFAERRIGRCAMSSWTGPPSGTGANSNASWSSSSTTTTATAPTGPSTNGHPNTAHPGPQHPARWLETIRCGGPINKYRNAA